jgi:hypothetical protein
MQARTVMVSRSRELLIAAGLPPVVADAALDASA